MSEIKRGYTRVSEVLDFYKPQYLVDWMIREGKIKCREISNRALKIGTEVHSRIEGNEPKKKLVYGGKSLIPEVNSCMKAWDRFRKDHPFEIYKAEERLYCDVLKITGAFDILTTDKKLLDIKTSGSIDAKFWIQLAVYAYLIELHYPSIKIERVGIIRLDKELGEYEYQERLYESEWLAVFIGMLKAKRYFDGYTGGA